MPLLGVAGEQSWRYAWLVLPLATALLAGAAVARHGGSSEVSAAAAAPMRAALEAPGVGRWLAAEMLANTAWAGTLVDSGVLFVESYQVSSAATGGVLAVGAVAYVCGNLALRLLSGRGPMRLLVALSAVLAVATGLFGAFRPSLLASMALFSVAAFAAGGRAFTSRTFGGGPRGFTAPRVESEPRVGGGYRIAMQPPEGGLFHLSGEFREVEPPFRLAYTFRWDPPAADDRETVVILALEDRGERTKIVLT